MRNIALIGFSTTGKSIVARKVAERLCWNFMDTDDEVVALTGKMIPEIFKQDGESQFRQLEHEVLKNACSRENLIISTGGGIILDPENRRLLSESCIVICLEARVSTIYRRLLQDTIYSVNPVTRPLLEGENPMQKIQEIKSARQIYYADADWTVHTDNLSVEEVASEVIRGYNHALCSIKNAVQTANVDVACIVETPLNGYPIFVGWGLLNTLGEKLVRAGQFNKAVIVSDDNVFAIYGETARQSLAHSGFSVSCFTVMPGEPSKNIRQAIEIYDYLIENHIARDDVIISLGGGMVGDLAGFVAATYLRGIPWIQVPTSLIGMVDASIGGKVAVDHIRGKNLIGAFYQPMFVISDVQTLTSLPQRELISGWAEVIKHGLVLDAEFLNMVERNSDDLKNLMPDITNRVIARSACIKARVVSEDERDNAGKRIVLNYGHTVAHGLETASGYGSFLHGEAVSIGMVAAAKLSYRLGLLAEDQVWRQQSILEKFGLPVNCTGANLDNVLASIEVDKKVRNKSVQWVLLKDIGEAVVRADVSRNDVENVLKEVINT
jgi:shikimate kinase/3-dehydroquinate synthase